MTEYEFAAGLRWNRDRMRARRTMMQVRATRLAHEDVDPMDLCAEEIAGGADETESMIRAADTMNTRAIDRAMKRDHAKHSR